METTKHHNFHLGFKNKIEKGNRQSLYVMYKHGNGKLHKKVTPIRLLGEDWDKANKHLNKKLQLNESYSPHTKWIDTFYATKRLVQIEMDKGEMALDTAWALIFNRNSSGDIREFLNTYSKLDSGQQRAKHLTRIDSIEKHLPNELKPLAFSHTQDSVAINKIASLLKASTLKNSTIGDYLKTLDYVTREAKLKINSPFKTEGHIPKAERNNKRPRTFKDIIQGFNNIKTKKDFLSINFWLYSLCLRGLNGIDICCLSEDWIGSGSYKDAYYPDHIIDPDSYGNLSEKTHLSRKRGKSLGNSDMTILLNLLPTYLLHQSLRQLIKEEYPQYAYKGKDRLRLFNFTTKDLNYKTNEDGKRKWTLIKDTISPKTSKLIGEGINNARHTFISSAEGLASVSDDDQRKLLGHKAEKSLGHYQSPRQMKIDLNHIKTLDEMRILTLVKYFYQLGKDKGFITQYLTPFTKYMLDDEALMRFSAEDELKLMQLTAEWRDKPEYKLIDGQLTEVEKEKPERLLNLEKQKESLMVVRNKDKSWTAQATDKMTGFISKKDALNYEDAWTTSKSLELLNTN